MDEYKRYILFANENSGNYSLKKVEEVKTVLQFAKDKLRGTTIISKSLSDLEQKVEKSKNYYPEIVLIMGGDGTVEKVRTFSENIWGFRPEFYAFLPEGTVNNVHAIHKPYNRLKDNFKKKLHLKNTTSMKLVKHIVHRICLNQPFEYQSIPSIDVNGIKSFNVGFGIIPKLLWLYYGGDIKGYKELEKKSNQYGGSNQYELVQQYLKESGAKSTIKTSFKILNGLRDKNSIISYFFTETMEGDFFVDGEKYQAEEALKGIYLSSYEQVNLGIPYMNPILTPGARAVPGKLQAVATYSEPQDLVKQLPKIMRGEKMKKTVYLHLSEMRIPGGICQAEGELISAPKFIIKYDQEAKVISKN